MYILLTNVASSSSLPVLHNFYKAETWISPAETVPPTIHFHATRCLLLCLYLKAKSMYCHPQYNWAPRNSSNCRKIARRSRMEPSIVYILWVPSKNALLPRIRIPAGALLQSRLEWVFLVCIQSAVTSIRFTWFFGGIWRIGSQLKSIERH